MTNFEYDCRPVSYTHLDVYKRQTLQERLNNLAILATENELATSNNFSDIIDQFAQRKARKTTLHYLNILEVGFSFTYNWL